ncbi:MAG: hypothetical protein ACP5RD_04065 [bacterium]|jgi:TusA-related sulfurtransferase
MELQLLTKAIEKAIDQNDIDFLLDILMKYDELFDLVLEKICDNYSKRESKDLYLKGIIDFLYSIVEFRKGNYDRSRYWAYLSYSKGLKEIANLVLILIDINESLELNKEFSKGKFISIVSKILDDIVLLEYALLKYYSVFGKLSLFNLIYNLKTIFVKNENLFILELYFLKEIDNLDYNHILKILLDNIDKYENIQYILEMFYELFYKEIELFKDNDEYYYSFKLKEMLKKYDIY